MQHLRTAGNTYSEIASATGLSYDQVRRAIESDLAITVEKSPFPVFDDPLEAEGDALVLPDVEAPFHDSVFLEKTIDLAAAWGIERVIFAGDALHFNSLSSFSPGYTSAEAKSKLDPDAERKLLAFAHSLPEKEREEMIMFVVDLSSNIADENFSSELQISRRVLQDVTIAFRHVDYVLGNHDTRFLKMIGTPIFPEELLRLLEVKDKWRIAPYFYMRLHSGERTWLIEHPKNSAKSSAQRLASKHLANVAMAHSHRWAVEYDASGAYYAIHMGCCVDETRLPYVAQRHSTVDKHKLGALIIRDGFPHLLGEETPFTAMKRMYRAKNTKTNQNNGNG
jgi:hypothetical protein